jgi:MoxR-like ATPase
VDPTIDDNEAAWFAQRFAAVADNVSRALQGKHDIVRLALVALFADGHLLIEDVPGVGKTSLARAIAGSIAASTHRIQFTPDLLPSDITGVTVFNQKTQEFAFQPGAVFANVVVADEINRSSPKTQSALLEVMEEGAVTVDAVRHPVPQPFMVVATQNPVDLEGTYRLPEAQLDRFLLRVGIGYPDRDAERAIALTQSAPTTPLDQLTPVIDTATVGTMVTLAERVFVAPPVVDYLVDLAAATRRMPEVRLGISPRGMLALVRASRVKAASEGRGYVAPEDVKALAPAVFAHRLVLSPDAEMQRQTADDLVAGVLATHPVPGVTA